MSYADNPRHPNNPPSDPPSEPTGAVTKDSLANESISRGGGFADNDNAQALGVKGYQSTLATEDTTNAEVLPPAQSAPERDDYEDKTVKYPDAEAGQGYTGTFSPEGYRGGPSIATGRISPTARADDGGAGAGTGARPHVDQAPNYAADFPQQGQYKPKGEDLTEGGIPETKTFTGDVGGPNDPGRLAEKEFQKIDADSSAGIGNRGYGDVKDGGQYDSLDRSERA